MVAILARMTALLVAGPLLLACSGGSSNNASSTPTLEDQTALCRDVDNVEAALAQVRTSMVLALVPGNEPAFQSSVQTARAAINSLDTSSREFEGGADQVGDLRQGINDFQRLMATPDLVSVMPQLNQQMDVIAGDLDALRATGHCP